MQIHNDSLWIFLFLIKIIITIIPKSQSALTANGVNYEVEALISMKSVISDPSNQLANWDPTEVDPCNWSHVVCNGSRYVIKLVMSNARVSGPLSPSIGNLTYLENLVLKDNLFYGPIPTEIGNLVKLSNLDLSNNNFSGQIPPSLGLLTNLISLRLNNNSLSGPIPLSLANLTVDMELSFNNLSGKLPNVSNGTRLNVEGNPLLCSPGMLGRCSTNPLPMSSIFDDSRKGSSGSEKKIIIGLVVGGSVLVFGALSATLRYWYYNRKEDSEETGLDVELCYGQINCYGQIKRYTFRELQTATDNFNCELGSGGFANVYKGTLSDGSIVAVKRLKDKNAVRGEQQFKTEVEIIGLAVHRNLLRLLGYCITSNERILVYPYMPNGSVASRLREKPALDWPTRKKIALGSSRGLMYLHEQCDPKILHRDVKAANILLDKDFEAVVGDFGLAKLLNHKDSHVTTAVWGTVGHIAPEYLISGHSSEKTDVFSFGIFLLELITAERAVDFGRRECQHGYHHMFEWVKLMQQEKRLDELVDKELKDGYDLLELEAMVQVALLCTQSYTPAERPRMAEVVRMLEGDGLVERWEALQKADTDRHLDPEPRPQYKNLLLDYDSMAFSSAQSGVQLSGPR